MATTFTDAVAGRVAVHTLQGRTDETGTAATDVDGQDLRISSDFLTQGIGNRLDGYQVLAQSPTPAMAVDVGSGTIGDIAHLDGTDPQQGDYIVSWPDATTEVTVPAADASDPRIDEIYLVVEDNQFDLSGRTLARLALRDGTPAATPTAPGPDSAWTAFVLLAEVLVGAGVTEITNTDITDQRVYTNITLGGSARLNVDNTDPNITRLTGPAGGSIELARDTDLAGNDITNVGTVDGVDVSSHASRHGEGGADPLTITTGMYGFNSIDIAAMGPDSVGRGQLVDEAVGPAEMSGPSVAAFITTRSATSNTDVSMTTSFQDVASFTFNKPSGWGTYEALVEGHIGGSATSVRVRLGGNNGPSSDIDSVADRFTGIVGSSNVVAVQALHSSGSGTVVGGVVSATFIRTS